MYTGILHTHKLVVLIFMVYYLVRLILLVTNKHEALEKVSKKFKIPDMIVSTLFLVTGIYLATQAPSISVGNWFVVKLTLVFISIPIAIIGFKKKNKGLALLGLLIILVAYRLSEVKSITFKKGEFATQIASNSNVDLKNISDPMELGAAVFTTKCVICHGNDGKLNQAGAKDLSISPKSVEEMRDVIGKGKNSMPSFKDNLNQNEIDAVVAHIRAKIMDPAIQPIINK